MNLPMSFSFRVQGHEGFTHSVKRNAHWDYEVKWARGWHQHMGGLVMMVWTEDQVTDMLKGTWRIVDESPKVEVKQELPDRSASLPDVFYFVGEGFEMDYYKAVREFHQYRITWPGCTESTTYFVSSVEKFVLRGGWKIIEKPTLTPEQQRTNKEFRERIAALEQSIKLNQQDVEHKKRLIEQYEYAVKDLQGKIVEEV